MSRRTAVYVCHCGQNIASAVDVEAVVRAAENAPGVALVRHYPYLCSRPGQDLIAEDLRGGGIDRVVVAACSPRMHEATFRRVLADNGLNPFLLQHVNIRDQCAWVHPDRAAATAKARDLVAMGAARVRRHEPLAGGRAPVERRVLVLGGGPAGLAAAETAAAAGIAVTLVEAADRLGGRALDLGRSFPDGEEVGPWLAGRVEAAAAHPRIEVLTGAVLDALDGTPGRFEATIRTPAGPLRRTAGAVVVATGYSLFRPDATGDGRPELGYGRYPGVITQEDLERELRAPPAPGAAAPGAVAFVQCVGSRDRTAGAEHCSRVCCMVSVRQAAELKARHPDARIEVLYIDLRAYARGAEEAYEAAGRAGVVFRRGSVSEVYRGGDGLVVRFEDTLLGEVRELPVDRVVLACGARPRPEAGSVARAVGLARGPDGFFLEAHPKLRPVDTATAGVFLAGACLGPRTLDEAVTSGRAAAGRAAGLLLRGWLAVDPAVAAIDPDRCSGCGLCQATCPASAVVRLGHRAACAVEASACRGCGACAAACPSHAVVLRHHRDDQVLAEVERAGG